MYQHFRKIIFSLTVFLILAVSAVNTVPAYADDGTPPVEIPSVEQPVQLPEQDSAEEEATPPSTPEPDSVSIDILLPELPAGTEVIVLDAQGETLPLATEEAAEVLASSDPIWCPASVVTPTPGMNGCTQSFGQFVTGNVNTGLLDYLMVNQPGVDGAIWITGYTNVDNASIIFDGATTLANMANFKLTINGGWNGAGTKTLDLLAPSTFDVGLAVINWKNDVTINNILVSGTPILDGVRVITTGAINLNNVESSGNAEDGAELNNTAGTGAVTVKNSKFNSNTTQNGLLIVSSGAITLTNVTANSNGGYGIILTTPGSLVLTNIQTNSNLWHGAEMDNTSGLGNVTLTTGQFNANSGSGLRLFSKGIVTLKDITANGNFEAGAFVDNSTSPTPKAVTVNGLNTFSNNTNGSGLYVLSLGAITLNDITASKNGVYGAYAKNNAAGVGAVALTGTNIFSENGAGGLLVLSNGAIKVNNVASFSNTGDGISLNNEMALTPQPITLTGITMAKYNDSIGIYIRSMGVLTASNLTMNYNNIGADIDNSTGGKLTGVTLSGINSFSNNQVYGLYLISTGTISLSNISANGNLGGGGATIDNSGASSPMNVTLLGTNSFNVNFHTGLQILSRGVVTVNALAANGNGSVTGGHGVTITNAFSAGISKGVSISGVNSTNNNWENGVQINSYGAITVSNLTSNGNGSVGNGYGLYITNHGAVTAAPVTLTGTNVLNNNYDDNLYILSKGFVTVSNVTANGSSHGFGVNIDNTYGTAGVTLSGTNSISSNKLTNLKINTMGAVSLSNITANSSFSGHGIQVNNGSLPSVAAVAISGVNSASGNWLRGMFVTSRGTISISNLTASNNGVGVFGSETHGLYVDNSFVTIPVGVTLSGTNTFNSNNGTNISIFTMGNILINNLTAKDSVNGYGAYLENFVMGTVVNTTLTGVNVLTGNKLDNLKIQTLGAVLLNSVTANGSVTGYGAYIANSMAIIPKAVTINGVNAFNANSMEGLHIESKGTVALSNVTANGNGLSGAQKGVSIATQSSVNLLGTNMVNDNTEDGLYVATTGAITASNLTANGNDLGGAWLQTNSKGSSITLTGVNTFTGNGFNGLQITSDGAVVLNNITANSNANNGMGVNINNAFNVLGKPVTLAGTNIFSNNSSSGLMIVTYGVIVTNNLTANGNGSDGAYMENNGGSPVSNITMNGVNTFTLNDGSGVRVYSKGTITVSAISATFNGQSGTGGGAVFENDNSTSLMSVTLNGVNTFNGNNGNGLEVASRGSVILSNITANDNLLNGAYVNNTFSGTATPKPVSLVGVNKFNTNGLNGLVIYSNGVITTNNLTANSNDAVGYSGVALFNDTATIAAAVIMNGVNTFNGNHTAGLRVYSIGSVTLNNITANNTLSASGAAVIVDNDMGASTAFVTVNGVNTFTGNSNSGLSISSMGVVNLTKITADDNNVTGLMVVTTGSVNLTCGYFTNNTVYGWQITIPTPAIATLKGVISVGNGTSDSFFPGTGVLKQSIACPLP